MRCKYFAPLKSNQRYVNSSILFGIEMRLEKEINTNKPHQPDEDYCAECTSDYANGKLHIDIWTGSSTSSGGQEQINCEDSLTPSWDVVIVRSPDSSYAVDTAPLYHQVCILSTEQAKRNCDCDWSETDELGRERVTLAGRTMFILMLRLILIAHEGVLGV